MCEVGHLTAKERESISVEELTQLVLRCVKEGQQETGTIGKRVRLPVSKVWEILFQLCPAAHRSDGVSGWPGYCGIWVPQSDFAFARRFFESIALLQRDALVVLVDWEEHPRAIQVEAGIFDLTYALNRVESTRTTSSCQGHEYVHTRTHAFVTFQCPAEVAMQLARIVRHHQGFSISISYGRQIPQQVQCEIKIVYVEMPPRPDSLSMPLKQLQAEFIADMGSAGLLTQEATLILIPFVPWNTDEGSFLPEAQKIIDEAFQTAAQLGHRYVDCEHLLFALLKNLPPGKNVMQLFDMLRIFPQDILQMLEADLRGLPPEKGQPEPQLHREAELVRSKVEAGRPDGSPKLTGDAAEALRMASMYTRERGQRNVSGFHLVHGVCRYLLRETEKSYLVSLAASEETT